MVKLKTKNQSDRQTVISDRNFRRQNLLLFILASLFIHSLGLLIFGVYQHRHLANKEKIDSKPIEFVVIPPEESKQKPSPETQKRAVEDSVAEKTTEPKKTVVSEELAEETPLRPTPPPAPSPPSPPPQAVAPPQSPPKPTPPSPPQAATTPKPTPQPVAPPNPTPPVKSQPTPSSTENQPPVLSGSDAGVTTPKPTQKDNPVATRLPPNNNQPSESIPESAPSQPTTNPLEQPSTTGDAGAAGLLGGDYQKTLADGGADAFFSPEALEYEKVLNPDQLNALKDLDLSEYFAEIKRRVKSNWQPSYAVEEYTTFLTFEIQKNGQVTGLRVSQSSGSEQVDRESLVAVQNSAPFAPLPPEFPLEAMDVEFSFNIYIY
ncbi:MAG: TonB family protein [Waterburya sp.]